MQSVLTALRVLEAVSLHRGVGVSELARALDLPKSNVQRALTTLREAGWLMTDSSGSPQWMLAAKATIIGQRAETYRLHLAAEPVMHELRAQTHETIHLMTSEGDEVVLIDRLDGSLPVRTFLALGSRTPLVASANGKVTLAHLPQRRIDAVCARGLQRYTDKTITDVDTLLAELDAVREQGYAVNRGEHDADVAAVASAIVVDDVPVGSMSISLPSHRLDDALVERFAPLVIAATAEVERALQRSAS